MSGTVCKKVIVIMDVDIQPVDDAEGQRLEEGNSVTRNRIQKEIAEWIARRLDTTNLKPRFYFRGFRKYPDDDANGEVII
jgi:hypothetical protein